MSHLYHLAALGPIQHYPARPHQAISQIHEESIYKPKGNGKACFWSYLACSCNQILWENQLTKGLSWPTQLEGMVHCGGKLQWQAHEVASHMTFRVEK